MNDEKAVGLSYKEGSTAAMPIAKTGEEIIQSEPKQKKPSKPDNSKSPSRTSTEKSDSKISALESKVSELEKKISGIKSELKGINDVDALEKKVSELEQKVSRISSSKSWFDGITFQIDIFSIFISFILSLFLFLILKSSKEPQSELQNYSQEIARQQNELQRQSQKIAEYGQTISQLQDKIQQLESKLQEVQHSSPQIVVPVQTPLYASSVSPAPEPAQSSQSHQEEVFYLSTPNSDGSFNRSSASSEYREGASVYRFMKTSHNRATFEVDEREGAIRLALDYHYRAIEPVCEAENTFVREARGIKTIHPGEAELQGEKWVVTRKAKIRYEY
ncbi:hypothetical protein [Fervidobacterium sp.]